MSPWKRPLMLSMMLAISRAYQRRTRPLVIQTLRRTFPPRRQLSPGPPSKRSSTLRVAVCHSDQTCPSSVSRRPEFLPGCGLSYRAFEQKGGTQQDHQERQRLVARKATNEFWRVTNEFRHKAKHAVKNQIQRKQPAKKNLALKQ